MRDRCCGILVHPTSIPGPFGIGDLGSETVRFLDWAAEAGQRVWQLLPLGPTGAGYSPYTIQSGFAGNPLLISPRRLEQRGWLPGSVVSQATDAVTDRIDFAQLIPWKHRLLRESWNHFQASMATVVTMPSVTSWATSEATFIASARISIPGPSPL